MPASCRTANPRLRNPRPPRPPGSGLSSSAAIVCSSMLATLAALGRGDQLSKAAIAESACKVRQLRRYGSTAMHYSPAGQGRHRGRPASLLTRRADSKVRQLIRTVRHYVWRSLQDGVRQGRHGGPLSCWEGLGPPPPPPR